MHKQFCAFGLLSVVNLFPLMYGMYNIKFTSAHKQVRFTSTKISEWRKRLCILLVQGLGSVINNARNEQCNIYCKRMAFSFYKCERIWK